MAILKAETINLPWFFQLLANQHPKKWSSFPIKTPSNTWKVWNYGKRKVSTRCSRKYQSRSSKSSTEQWHLTLVPVPQSTRSSNTNSLQNAEGRSCSSWESRSWWSLRWVRRTWPCKTWSSASRKNWLNTIPRNDDLYLIIIKSWKVKRITIMGWKQKQSRKDLALVTIILFITLLIF